MPNKWMPEDWTEFLCEHLEAETYRLGGVVDMGHKRAAVLCGICHKANLMTSLEQIAKTADRINRTTANSVDLTDSIRSDRRVTD